MKLISCYCCGNECKDWEDPKYKSVCRSCAVEVYTASGLVVPTTIAKGTDPKVGDGFPYPPAYDAWVKDVEAVKARHQGALPTKVALTHSGMKCTKCGNGNDYAEPNQKDGTFVCYSCR